jgi:hypothetical protein
MARRLTALLALMAGAGMAAGSLLAWLQLSSKGIAFAEGSVAGQAAGVDTAFGWVALVGGAVTAVCGVAMLATSRWRRAAAGLVLIAAVATAVVAAYVSTTVRERFVDFAVDTASTREFTPAEVRAEMDRLFVQNAVDVTPGAGLIVTGAGAVVAVVAGAVALLPARHRGGS